MRSVSSEKNGETCIICEQLKWKGIHVYTSFICVDCERDIISTPTNNPKYKHYVRQLNRINTPQIYLK